MTRPVASLAGFALMAAFASFHWFALVSEPALWRWGLCVALAIAGGIALIALGSLQGRRAAFAVAALTAVALLAGGLMAIGIPARLLAPGAWGELAGEVRSGLAGVNEVELPYAGGDAWTRLGVLVAAPLTLTITAAIMLWPSARWETTRRGVALALLIALYAIAVTWEAPTHELARGAALLACVAAFIWLPRLPASRALVAALAVALAGAVALPAAARVDSSGPLVDYARWSIFGDEEFARYSWTHRYGPLDWPQRGTELFEVTADRPLYWKTAVLSEFDGAVWTWGGASPLGTEVRPQLAGVSTEVMARRADWLESFDVSVRGLRSELLVTAGTTRQVDGIDAEPSRADGTTALPGAGLEEGSAYTVSAYAPDPPARLLRRSDDGRYPRALEAYTTLLLPSRMGPSGSLDTLVPVTTPLRGRPARPTAVGATPRALIAGTPYARVEALARRITRGARGNYEVVAAIERFLLENYSYRQEVPDRRDPLPAFLFRDRAGYCQQFSGAMALMLRLVGVPSRVAAGFAPGFLDDPGDDRFVVLDTDAHSWVEVWFPRVGWVTVDPTPGIAPARSESLNSLSRQLDGARGGLRPAFAIEEAGGDDTSPARRAAPGRDGGSPIGLAVPLAFAVGGFVFWRRRERLLSAGGERLQLAELQRALALMGHRIPPGATLLSLERDLGPAVGPALVRYTAWLREHRYRSERARRPGPTERRALRRALARGGPVKRLRAWRAIPPGGPRRR